MECHYSLAKLTILFVAGLVLVVMGLFLVFQDDEGTRILGGMALAFFVPPLGMIFSKLFWLQPVVVIDGAGIEDRRLQLGCIPWSEIESLSFRTLAVKRAEANYLCIELNDPEKWWSQLAFWRRWLAQANYAMGFGALTIGFAGLKPGIHEVGQHLQTHHGSKMRANRDLLEI